MADVESGASNNNDTVRSIAELIPPKNDDCDDIDFRVNTTININNELKKRGLPPPPLNRVDSQIPESILAKKRDDEKPKFTITKKVIGEIVLVCLLGVSIVTSVVMIYLFYTAEEYEKEIGRRIYFNQETRLIHVNNVNKETILFGHLGLDIPEFHLPNDCSDKDRSGVELCMKWRDEATLNITYFEENGKSCYDIEWKSFDPNIRPHDCYQLSGGHWYGGGLRQLQQWPVDKMSYEATVMLPGNLHNDDSFGPVVERYWLSSLGVAMMVENDAPLYVKMNETETDDQICFLADYRDQIYPSKPGQFAKLNYTICVGKDVKDIHQYVVNKIGKPSDTSPEEKYFQSPVWSIGSQYGLYNQTEVAEYSNLIAGDQDYLHSMLVLDQGWQEKEGDLDFDAARFPNPDQMIDDLRSKGFDVCLAVHPFVNTDSATFQTAIANDTLVLDGSHVSPGLHRWWTAPLPEFHQGVAASIDMHETQWWEDKFRALLQKYGSLKFRMNHGDREFLPYRARFHGKYVNPGNYSRHLAAFVANLGPSGQVQSVYRAQNQSVIVRLGNFNSTWESLQSVIPSVLHAGIIGYPYIMPDIIGGNVYDRSLPEKELYIRWLQLSTFLPFMQFSVHPSKYDSATDAIAKAMIELRTNFVATRVVNLANAASKTMDPIIRPMWWPDPTDTETFSLDDQFMLGDDMLIAPVLTEGSRSRDIYFPLGTWRDLVSNIQYTGPGWERSISVPLNKALCFILENSD